MKPYVHGYGTPEQERLVEQAEHWRNRLITDGTQLQPGTHLLEVGCGVGAVLAVLGQEFPGVSLVGVDIEPKQLDFARGHLARAGVEATLLEADALELPFGDESFDYVWMMWLLEHIADPPAVLREARRVLVAGGAITAIEVDYSTCRASPSSPAIEALFRAMVQGMAASGWSDAGTRLPGWLREAGFGDVQEGEQSFWWQDEDLAGQARYAADVIESALEALAQLPVSPKRSCGQVWATYAAWEASPAQVSAGSCISRRLSVSDGKVRVYLAVLIFAVTSATAGSALRCP